MADSKIGSAWKWLAAAAVLLIGAVSAVYLYGRFSFNLQVLRYDFILPPGYETLNGRKIVFFSDMHMLDTADDLQRFRAITKQINRENPDLICFVGDLLASDNLEGALPPARIISRMRELHSVYGVYAVTGNHDWYSGYGESVTRMMKQAGITVLDNRNTVIPGLCNLVGVQDQDGPQGMHPEKAMSGCASGLPVIALIHRPEYRRKFPGKVKLFLAGHTHGGQVRLPLIQRLLLEHNGCAAFPNHVYDYPDGSRLFISYGIGTSWIRTRLNCPSDIIVINCKDK